MNKNLKLLLLTASLFLFAGGLFGPIYAVFVEDIGGDLLTAGAAFGTFSIVVNTLPKNVFCSSVDPRSVVSGTNSVVDLAIPKSDNNN